MSDNKGKNNPILSIEDLIRQDSIFPENIFDILMSQEESIYHDFKLSFNLQENSDILKLTKDFLAFANTHGGYLLFGIKNKTLEKIGLSNSEFYQLSDSNNIMQKINSYIEPKITDIRIKKIENIKKFIIIFIPNNKRSTHIVQKNGTFKDGSGKERFILREGQIYIRRSSQSIVANHSDFEKLIERRIIDFRNQIFSNIEKTIYKTIPGQEIIIARDRTSEKKGNLYRLSDSPDAIEVKGLPTTIPPNSSEEVLVTLIALYNHNNKFIPPDYLLYDFYSNRNRINVQITQIPYIIKFSILNELPLFYWLINYNKDSMIIMLKDMFNNVNFSKKEYILRISYFIDKSLFKMLKKKTNKINAIGKEYREVNKYNGYNLFIPSIYLNNTKVFKGIRPIFQDDEEELSKEATDLAAKLSAGSKDIKIKNRLILLDCRLYAKKVFSQYSFV